MGRGRRSLVAGASILFVLSAALPAWASHQSFVWTAPTTNEDGTPLTDLGGYRVYTCPASPCSKATGTLLGTTAAGVTTLAVPHGKSGMAFTTAFDTSGNESMESNVVPFDTLPPAAPGGLTVQ